jgi:uncharacterized protein YecE (DUF72 family)
MIKIGTSGYSFKDWKGSFYPLECPDNKMFDFYTGIFDTVEINSTYYRIPNFMVFYHLNKKCSDNYQFIVKANQETTHKRNKNKETILELKEALKPIIESGKLKGILAQFPFSFRYNIKNIEYLKNTKDYFAEIPLIVEFRHDSWSRDETYEFFKEQNITYTCVDEPNLNNLLPRQDIVTSNIGYIRFHGRNRNNWYDTSKGDRYDYQYNEKELLEWLNIIKNVEQKSETTYIFFNNCHHGSAPLNAQMMKKLLELK